MEREIEQMRGSITALKNKSTSKKVNKKPAPAYKPAPAPSVSARPRASASTSKAPGGSGRHADAPPKKKPAPGRKSGGGASGTTDDDVLTFEQKKDLSEAIGGLDGAKLEKVIQIIHEGVPEIRDVSSLFFVMAAYSCCLFRVRKKSSWRSTYYPRTCSLNCTTLLSALHYARVRPNDLVRVKARVRAG